ncbi:amidohydrolase family protein [Marine Group I thaumarchaeote]|mgnify:CR=1 FL=1|jgi:dihydropyrimidinase|uniref:Amidohydrolase family protein n=1 Tax=Marine Group I thaumarchaeote TaxID=2511932 RepID=A0A7K4MVS5_9ARCH|nr:MAG: dihydroorotase [Nitrosopumilus sp. YT1]NMI81894.1 dihydroorotase [Candidatus Nitrosopumilus sp. MTA1]NWJ19835.1 amidohydrolase family protein [Marine Group I thaumarchaeote]NWJ29161.1 amidohydrolase family protein [Marine Group I thaumarchaeote]NWJ57582.1 amidohydrolase family protein [Marine Group I thaumarchaeote]
MTYDTVITDSHIILPQGMIDKNILIDEGKIVGFTNDTPACDNKINGNGLISVPGPIDTHVHYGVYSPINEAAKTESHAAAIGGITTMMRMLRLKDPFSNSLQAQLDASSYSHYIDYAIHASVFTPQQINEMNICVEKGITSFKIYMNLGGEVGHVYMDIPPNSSKLVESQVNVTNEIVEQTVKTAASLGCPILVHAEDYESCGCGIKTAKEKNQDGLSAWSNSRSPEFEAKAIKTVSKYGRDYDCVIYFAHIGSERALAQIEEEKKLGTKIFVETCPHYLSLSYDKQEGYLAKVMPPIRTENDNKAVWNALSKNQIDTIGTDHVANQLKLKLAGDDVWGALAGFPGIGTVIPILLNDGVNQNRITLEQFVQFTSQNAAKIFGMYPQKGTLEKNSDADITMIDLKREKKVTSDLFGGFSDYIVYEGRNLKGWPVKTIVRGEIVADDFEIIGKLGHGKLVERKIN